MSDDPHALSEQPAGTSATEFEALQAVIAVLRNLDQNARHRILESTATFLGISPIHSKAREVGNSPLSSDPANISYSARAPFSKDTSMSPKEFLMEKAPRTDVERVACLAYYLTHYRSIPHFKTLDISMLNTEAAQPKFSNTTYSTNNAVKLGYIVPSTKGQRQLSALGERFVQALPDRNAAKEVLLSMRRRNRGKRKRNSSETAAEE